MAQTLLGMEFGNSYVSIVKQGEGLVLKQANLVAVKKEHNDYSNYCVGEKAKNLLGKTDDRIVVFSPVNGGEIISLPHAIYELKQYINQLQIKKNFFNKLKIILAISTAVSEEEKHKYIELCESVGAKEVLLVPKIICSALGENINISANNARLVVDIGGGTVECAVINLNTIIQGSTLQLGGRNLDTTIVDYVKQKYNAIIGIKVAQQIKEQIGSLYPNDSAEMEVNAVDVNTNTPMYIKVSAKDIYEATYMFLDEVIKIIKTTINTLSPEISSDVVRNGITICGGYSKMVGLEKYLRQKLGLNILISDNSENATINGLNKLVNRQDLLEKILINL